MISGGRLGTLGTKGALGTNGLISSIKVCN